MKTLKDYNNKLAEIQAIAMEDVKEPTMPVDALLQEAEILYHWAIDGAEMLLPLGITTEMIEELPVRAGACRSAQGIWNNDFKSQLEAQRLWAKQYPGAYRFRNNLLASLRYAYRKHPELLSRVKAISKGGSHVDIIQDLTDIAIMGQKNPEPLIAISFDMDQMKLAHTRSDELADLLHRANGDKADHNESKLIRDRAYTYLKMLMDEIRDAGKYAFHNKAVREKGYMSSFFRRKNNKQRTKDSDMDASDQ